MRNHIKPILSVFALAAFLCIAYASEFLEESTNTEINAVSCQMLPEISGHMVITVLYLDEDKDPLAGLAGTLSINHQVINDTSNCKYYNNQAFITFHLDAAGKYTYDAGTFTHDNAADLFRVEVKIAGSPHEWEGFRETKVAHYDEQLIAFTKIDPTEL